VAAIPRTTPGPDRWRSAVLLAAAAALLAGCGGSGYGGSTDTGAAASPSASSGGGGGGAYGRTYSAAPSAAAAATVTVHTTRLGGTPADAAGRTLYLFEKDKGTSSACYGACATAWPPASTTAAPKVTGGAVSGLLGTSLRSDGTKQLTYAGHPLHYFSGECSPGDVLGEGSHAFGGAWFAVGAQGQKS